MQLGSGVSLVGGVSIGFGLPVLHSGGGGKTVVHTSIVLVAIIVRKIIDRVESEANSNAGFYDET